MPDAVKMPVRLRVFDIAADKEIRCFEHNYNSRHHRARIAKTMFWALNSGHAIELIRIQDDK